MEGCGQPGSGLQLPARTPWLISTRPDIGRRTCWKDNPLPAFGATSLALTYDSKDRPKGRFEVLAANLLQGSGSGFTVPLALVVVLVGMGAVIGSLWTRGRERNR